ncbi:hypothetical protein [Sporomusa sp.]|uniref:hypothetical protein n=1 Tax=Sporomusa sp. TaxID=2078658 RepID=UPI002D095C2C|nr:hypothetical protein [Sporomusa sp.]HWR41608.1 hypothetical protein [Sporomusa sp.]
MSLNECIMLFEAFKNSMDSLPECNSIDLAKELLSEESIDVHQIINEYFKKYPLTIKSSDEIQNDENLMQSLGLNMDYLKSNFIDEWAHEQAMSNSSFSIERYQYMFPQKQGSPPLYNTYIYAALEQGVVRAVCPYSGEVLETSTSFPIFLEEKWAHIVFYQIKGREPFYIGTAGYPSLKSFVYLPKHNLVIGSPAFFHLGYTKEHLFFAIAELYRKFLIFTEKTVNYLQNSIRNLALIYGLQTNLGHFLTNEYSGYYRITTTGLYRKVKNIITYKNKKVPLEQLFTEFKKDTFYNCDNEDQLFEICMTNGLFVLYPCAAHLSAEAAFHIQQIANTYGSDSQKRLIAHCVADPLIFINLRKHNKAWQEQVDGIINLARALKQTYPNVGIFLDGLSDCQEDAELISHSLDGDIVVYIGVDISLMDTICWASRTDAYLCVIGSGLVLLTCIANKPGIVHSEYVHMGQVRPGGYWSGLRNDIFAPILVSWDEIIVLPEKSRHLPAIYANYSMDWHSLYNRLIKILYPPS